MTDQSNITETTAHLGHAIAYLLRPDMPPLSPDQRSDIASHLRRFLALTETGPDYERADAAFRIALATKGIEVEGLPTAQVSRAIVDAALADYLTEEPE